MEFSQITPTNAGRYYCLAVNPNGNATKAAEVIVHHNEIPDRSPESTEGRVIEVMEGDTVSIDCHEYPGARVSTFHTILRERNRFCKRIFFSMGIQLNWRREYGEIPSTARFDRNRLILLSIRAEDTGRYICQKIEPNGQVTQNYRDVVLKREYRRRRHVRNFSFRWQ